MKAPLVTDSLSLLDTASRDDWSETSDTLLGEALRPAFPEEGIDTAAAALSVIVVVALLAFAPLPQECVTQCERASPRQPNLRILAVEYNVYVPDV